MNRRAGKKRRDKRASQSKPAVDLVSLPTPPSKDRLDVSCFKQWEQNAMKRLHLANDQCQLGWQVRMCRGLELSTKVTPQTDRKIAFSKRCAKCFIGGDIDVALIKLSKLLCERYVVKYNTGPVDLGTCYNEIHINRILTELINLQLLFLSGQTSCSCLTNEVVPNGPNEMNPVDVLIEVMKAFDWTVYNISDKTHKVPDYWRNEILSGRADFSRDNTTIKVDEIHRHFGYNGNSVNAKFKNLDEINCLHKFGFHIAIRKSKSI